MPRFLVVDDSATDRCFAGGLLSKEPDAVVEYAASGVEALAAMERAAPQLVLTDLVMPEMDGLQLVAAVREKHPHVPIILMTSQGNEEIAVEALRRGAASYVSKSMLAAKLQETIRDVLIAARRGREQQRLRCCLEETIRRFVLASDASLFPPLIATLQDEAAQFNLWDESEQTRVGIALHEALMNALYHGNLEACRQLRETDEAAYHAHTESRRREPPYCDRRIHVEAVLSHEGARFTLRDEGPGFDPEALPDPTDPANLERVSGRGVLLMRTFMDRVQYNAQGNAVTLEKRRTSPATTPPQSN